MKEKAYQFFKNALVRKSVYVLFYRIAGVLIFFGLTLFLTNNFQAEGVGQYDFSRSLMIFLGAFCVFGMHQSVVFYSGFLKAQNAIGHLKHVYHKMLIIVASISLFFLLLSYLIPPSSIDQLFEKPVSGIVFKSVYALLFYGLTILNIDVFRAIDKVYTSEFFRNIMRFAPFFVGVLLIFYTAHTELLVDVFLLNFAFVGLLSTAILLFYFARQKDNQTAVNVSPGSILKRSGPMAISAVVYLLMQSVDVLLLSKYESFSEVAYYAVAIKLTTLITLVLSSVNAVYAPMFSELYNREEMDQLRLAIKRSTRLIFWLTFPAIIVLALLSGFALDLFGEGYVTARWALYILLFGQAINTFCGSSGVYMNMTGKQVVFQRILTVALLLNLGLNLLLIPVYGINGAAVATASSMILWNIATAGYIYKKDGVRTFLTIV